jgi:hypothetical protein
VVEGERLMGDEHDFHLYQRVRKKIGYKYPGIIVSIFRTTKGHVRFVVEADHFDFEGMLHIYSGAQIEPDIGSRRNLGFTDEEA